MFHIVFFKGKEKKIKTINTKLERKKKREIESAIDLSVRDKQIKS